jgi:hypothetical protein
MSNKKKATEGTQLPLKEQRLFHWSTLLVSVFSAIIAALGLSSTSGQTEPARAPPYTATAAVAPRERFESDELEAYVEQPHSSAAIDSGRGSDQLTKSGQFAAYVRGAHSSSARAAPAIDHDAALVTIDQGIDSINISQLRAEIYQKAAFFENLKYNLTYSRKEDQDVMRDLSAWTKISITLDENKKFKGYTIVIGPDEDVFSLETKKWHLIAGLSGRDLALNVLFGADHHTNEWTRTNRIYENTIAFLEAHKKSFDLTIGLGVDKTFAPTTQIKHGIIERNIMNMDTASIINKIDVVIENLKSILKGVDQMEANLSALNEQDASVTNKSWLDVGPELNYGLMLDQSKGSGE